MSKPIDSEDLALVVEAHPASNDVKEPIEEKEPSVVASVPLPADGREIATEEEEHTLRRVSDKVPWTAYTIAFVELCERFSYYGTTAVCMFFPILEGFLPDEESNNPSCQFHSAASPSGQQHWCWFLGAVWSSEHGPTRIHWPDHLYANKDNHFLAFTLTML